jgi:hypothetical protein
MTDTCLLSGAIRPSDIIDIWPSGDCIISYSLTDRVIGIREGLQMKIHAINFEFESDGPAITSLVAGSDGRLGSTAHPMRYFIYNPDGDELNSYTGHQASQVVTLPTLQCKAIKWWAELTTVASCTATIRKKRGRLIAS